MNIFLHQGDFVYCLFLLVRFTFFGAPFPSKNEPSTSSKDLYNKMRNRYQMRCSRAPGNQKMRDDYNAWRKQAQMALSKYQLGEISWEKFEKAIRTIN